MAASGHHMNMPGVPRVGSSLSRVSYPGEDVGPIRLPRAYSYNGVWPYPESRVGNTAYSMPDVSSYTGAGKGKDVVRLYDSQRVSSASSKGEYLRFVGGLAYMTAGDPSPVESSNDSTSSQDELEMKSAKPVARSVNGTHRLHPRNARRLSDSNVDKHSALGASAKAFPSTSRDSRPPPSTRGFASIPAVASLPPMSARDLPGSSAPSASFQQASHNGANTSPDGYFTTSTVPAPNASTPTSRPAAVTPPGFSVSSAARDEHPITWLSLPGPELNMPTSSQGMPQRPSTREGLEMVQKSSKPPGSCKIASYSSRMSSGDAVPMGSSGARNSYFEYPIMNSTQMPELSTQDLANVFPEQAAVDETSFNDAKGKKRLSKPGGKLVKKNRWSSSKVSAVAV